MTTAGHRYRARKHALTATEPDPPSLLQQLLDAVHGTGGTNGAPNAGWHRSPAALAALDLITQISRHLGQPRTELLEHTLHTWRPDDETTAAAQLDTWTATIRTLLDPPRNLEGVAPCPACGERYVRERDGDEWIRRAAIRIVITGNPADDYAQCLATKCRQTWPRTRWNLLAAAMTTDTP